MTDAEKLRYEQEVEERVKERLNVKELKNIRYLLEEMNRENANDHNLIKFNLKKLETLQRLHDESIEELKKQNWWTMLIDWLAAMVKKKESYVFPALIAIVAWWQQIIELIKSLIP